MQPIFEYTHEKRIREVQEAYQEFKEKDFNELIDKFDKKDFQEEEALTCQLP